MAQGRVVFDDVPAALTEHVARELYGLEAGEVMDGSEVADNTEGFAVSTAA
jgi:phosphonate transport system ATP-binding protein